jgi:hypothetical protein
MSLFVQSQTVVRTRNLALDLLVLLSAPHPITGTRTPTQTRQKKRRQIPAGTFCEAPYFLIKMACPSKL